MKQQVSIKGLIPGWTNFEICGYEWGGNHKQFNRDVWVYYVREPGNANRGKQQYTVAEDKIGGRISP